MFTALPVWLNVILTLAALVALAGGVFAFFKSDAGSKTLTLAAQEIKLLNERDQRREAEFQVCKTQLQTQANTIALLTDTVTGATAIKELAEIVKQNNKEVADAHRELVKKLNARARTARTRTTKARQRTR